MQPLVAMGANARGSVRGLLFDIDDTLTTEGRLTAAGLRRDGALAASGHLRRADHRPAGRLVRSHRAHVAGGRGGRRERRVLLPLRRDARRIARALHVDDAATRARKRERLAAIGAGILAQVPGCALASDQPYRETDLAIDFCEDVPPLPLAAVERIAALMRSRGLTAKMSSIHVNGWFGGYDKLAMTRQLMRRGVRHGSRRANATIVFVGDSPNDAPMFGYFPHSVGVANVRASRRASEAAEVRTVHPRARGSLKSSSICSVARRADTGRHTTKLASFAGFGSARARSLAGAGGGPFSPLLRLCGARR